MIINDHVYGKVDITAPILIELINSSALQRLKGIAQFGVPDKYYHKKNYYRFEHSLGVMILLKKLGTSEKEQIAGLIHDVSHTAFSHVVDWVIGSNKNEDFQDKQHALFLKKSDINKILIKYHLDLKDYLSNDNFSLLDLPIPELCADRIDYAIREMPLLTARYLFKSLRTFQNQIFFNNKKAALLFAKQFLKLHTLHWGAWETVVRYRLFAEAIKIAIKNSTITMKDLWNNDSFVVKKLEKSKNQQIINLLKILKTKTLKQLALGQITVQKKFRFVDPLYLKRDKLVRLSASSKIFNNLITNSRENNNLGVRLPDIIKTI